MANWLGDEVVCLTLTPLVTTVWLARVSIHFCDRRVLTGV